MQLISLVCLWLLKGLVLGEGQDVTLTSPTPILDCPVHQKPSNCSTPALCQGRCFGPHAMFCPLIRCYDYYVQCVCQEGHTRVEVNGRCIPENACAALCTGSEEYAECGSACPQTCDGTIPEECVEGTPRCVRTCQCKNGYLRRSTGGPCVLENDCKSAE